VPLTVLLVGNYLSAIGGSRSISEELAARLPSTGCAVVTTSFKPGRLGRLVDMTSTAWRRRDEYAVAQVDVFSGPAFVWAEAVCAVLRRARKPYVLTLHGGSLPVFAVRNPGRVRRLLQSAAAVTTPSGYLRDQMTECRPDIRVVPNGLDVGRYLPRNGREAGAKPRLVWLRAFHEVYNPTLAVRILPALAARFPDVHLTMIGPDKRDGSLQATERLVDELGVKAHVEFRGPIPKIDVPGNLIEADIFLNTTNVDNAPVTVVEAMACGLCIVTTDVGGCPYLVEDGQHGLLVPPRDADAMADAVRRVVEQPDLADRLSRQAREKATLFDWPPIVAEWRALLTAVAAGGTA
jgi:glycosyltransferase involved in cell wall biosynthesis